MVSKRLLSLKSEHFWGLVTLVVVTLVAALIIAVFRKPGQMGVIESQSMNMNNMRPASGAVPVAIAKATYMPIEGTVTYTGTVQSYTDEDVYPRITGRIASEPVYPGDRVRRGQLLVQLDAGANSEYASRAREAALAASAASHNQEIAKEEAEAKKAQAAASSSAQVEAKRALEQAQANLDYWTKEIQREKVLLDQQVVSKEEYDREQSQFEQAKAQVAQAKAKVDEAAHTRVAAVNEAEAGIHHSMHQSEEAARAEVEAQTAAIIQSYTRILASDSGIVTKRMFGPGNVVGPGMAIMRIAHIDRLRVQAQVSEQDINRISMGAPVTMTTSQNGSVIASGTVTAKFPSADPSSRTFIIESLIPNPGYRLLPGQYIVMSIGTGSMAGGLAVPSSAIVWSGSQAQVWKAVGTKEHAVAQLQNVQVGNSNGKNTQIVSGLNEGDHVIYQGQSALTPGNAVVSVEWGANGPVNLPTPAQAAGIRMADSNKWTITLQPEPQFRVKVSMLPMPPKNSDNAMVFLVTDNMNMPLKGATIKASTTMPTMNMEGPDLTAKETDAGTYRMQSNFMSGLWAMDVTAKVNGRDSKFTVEADVP